MEAILIAVVNPASNKSSGTFAGAKKVFQEENEKSEGDTDTKLERIRAALEKIESRLTQIERK